MTLPTNTTSHDALTLAGGTRLRLRLIDRGDHGGVAALFARLSPDSRYRRFLSSKPELTPRELTYLTELDQVRHVAIAAVDPSDGSIAGIFRYVRAPDQAGRAEVALVVIDELQGVGIGTALANELVHRARCR